MRASIGTWSGGALLGLALLAFGLVRPDDGSVPFFVLLGLAAVGYLATLHQVAKGLWPSGRALIACAALALAWRIPMLLAPPEPAADIRRYLWDAHLVRAGAQPLCGGSGRPRVRASADQRELAGEQPRRAEPLPSRRPALLPRRDDARRIGASHQAGRPGVRRTPGARRLALAGGCRQEIRAGCWRTSGARSSRSRSPVTGISTWPALSCSPSLPSRSRAAGRWSAASHSRCRSR